jgi:diadenosine tetraphosphate (Ap4A) HIT family hydrolase
MTSRISSPLYRSRRCISRRIRTYRGQCSLIFDLRHAARPDQLTADEWAAFCADLYVAQRAVSAWTRPDHVNIESLGNVVPHLHWHIIPRYVGDPRWGMPIWTTPLSAMADTRLEANEHIALVQQLQAAIR